MPPKYLQQREELHLDRWMLEMDRAWESNDGILVYSRLLNTGKFFVSLGFKTDDGECIYTRLYLTDRAIEHSVKKLRDAFDFDGDFGNIESCVLDKRCKIVVAERESENGRTCVPTKSRKY